MRISLFTPTHDGRFLAETYQSVKAQAFDEWVIVRNGPALHQDFGFLAKDARVRVLDLDVELSSVGSLKRYACRACTGDVLFELDHDDLLAPGCIDEVRAVFASRPDVGFVYSNNAQFKGDGTRPPRFNEAHGWHWRDFAWGNAVYDEVRSFPPTPAAVSRVWYAPDHLRAWRTTAYWQAGGHDKAMRVLDDADLLMRTYLVTTFHHLDKCLYLYRVHDRNTFADQDKNAEIQNNTPVLYRKYIHKLCERWCDLQGLPKLDLGGRFNKPDGYLSVDLKDADIVADLRQPWPIASGSVGIVRAFDFLEHLPDKHFTISEIHRILAPGGYFFSFTPSALGEGAFQDPTHVSYWVRNSFLYYTNAEQAKYIDNTNVRFQEMLVENVYPSEAAKAMNLLYVRADLAKLPAPTRLPGIVSI